MILLDLGTNNMFGSPVATATAAMNKLLDDIYAASPNVWVIGASASTADAGAPRDAGRDVGTAAGSAVRRVIRVAEGLRMAGGGASSGAGGSNATGGNTGGTPAGTTGTRRPAQPLGLASALPRLSAGAAAARADEAGPPVARRARLAATETAAPGRRSGCTIGVVNGARS